MNMCVYITVLWNQIYSVKPLCSGQLKISSLMENDLCRARYSDNTCLLCSICGSTLPTSSWWASWVHGHHFHYYRSTPHNRDSSGRGIAICFYPNVNYNRSIHSLLLKVWLVVLCSSVPNLPDYDVCLFVCFLCVLNNCLIQLLKR